MLNVQAMTQTMSAMSLPQLQQYAAMHKNDPYTVALALSIANQKKQAMTAQQGQAGMQPMPKVVDQALAQMAPRAAPMPEDVGIGQLPAPNIAKMAGGGIVAFGDGGETDSREDSLIPEQSSINLLRGANKQRVGDKQIENLLLGLGIDKAAIGLNLSNLRQNDKDNLARNLMAAYNTQMGDVGVNASVVRPLDAPPGVYMGSLGASYPVGEGRIVAGLNALRSPDGETRTMGHNLGYSGKVGPGQLNAMMMQPKGAPQNRQYQMQYNIPFANGGEVPRYNGMGGSFVGPTMSFQQFLASYGITPSEFASAQTNEQQALRDMYKSMGTTPPSGAAPAAPAAPAAAAPTATTPTSPGRLYNIARTAGGFARSFAPVAGGLEVLGNLGGYKFQEPGLDTSVSGVADALGKGEFKQAAKNLAVGLPEAGLDLVRSGAGIGDIFLPGQPLTTGMDRLLKEKFGDKLRTPSDAMIASATPTSGSTIQGHGEGAFPGATTPGVNAAPPPATAAPTQQDKLAELKAQYQALVGPTSGAAPSAAGLPGLKMPTVEEAKASAAKLVDASPVIKQFEDYRKQTIADIANREKTFLEEQALLPKFGVKAEEQLKKREQELNEDKQAAGWMAVLEAGLATMASTSPFALANIGAGGQKGLASYKDAMKDFKKLQSEYDKMRLDIERAQVAEKREDFKARNDFYASAATRRDNLDKIGIEISANVFKTTADVGAQIWNNSMREFGETARTVYREQGAAARAADESRSRVALGLLGLAQPGQSQQLYESLADPNSKAAKGLGVYSNAMYGDKAAASLLKQYQTLAGEAQLKQMEAGTPQERLAAMQIRQRLKELQGVPAAVDVKNPLP